MRAAVRHSLGAPEFRSAGTRVGFTLIELLTVISIIAILATLLMSTVGSVKRKAREAVCMSNLRQIGLALHLYLDDFSKRPADLQTLSSSRYLAGAKVLVCPADKAAALAPSPSPSLVSPPVDNAAPGSGAAGVVIAPASASSALYVSYQSPLGWSDTDWDHLLQAHTQAGVVVCPFHDLRSRSTLLAGFGGADTLILRGQLDGAVVWRHVFPSAAQSQLDANGSKTAAPAASFGANSTFGPVTPIGPPWEYFCDDPPPQP